MANCRNCGCETFGSTYCSYDCDEDFYICQELDKSFKARLRPAKTFHEMLNDIDDRRLEEMEALEMMEAWDEIDMDLDEEKIKNLLPIEFHQPGVKSRDGFKRYIHARGDYQDEIGRDAVIGKKFLKREASRARRRMNKAAILDLAA